MTSAHSALVRGVTRRAEGNASLLLAHATLLFVPLPALLTILGPRSSQVGLGSTLATLGLLVSATPLFALVPFVLGCGIGTLLHLVITAPARFAAMRAEREVHLGGRSLVAMSMVVGTAFAASGLVAATTLFGVH